MPTPPPHAVLQHTPSTQLPVEHWLFVWHEVPFVNFGVHAFAVEQKSPLMHLLSSPLQPPPQEVPLHA